MHGSVLQLSISLRFLTELFELILKLFDFTTSLLIQVIEVSLEGIHLTLKTSLFFTVNHTPFLVFDLTSTHLGF